MYSINYIKFIIFFIIDFSLNSKEELLLKKFHIYKSFRISVFLKSLVLILFN
jgi:hypothetical protein